MNWDERKGARAAKLLEAAEGQSAPEAMKAMWEVIREAFREYRYANGFAEVSLIESEFGDLIEGLGNDDS